MKFESYGRGPLETLREIPDEPSVRIDPDQPVEGKLVDPQRDRIGREPRIERERRALEVDAEVSGGRDRRGAASAADRVGKNGGDERDHYRHTRHRGDRTRP